MNRRRLQATVAYSISVVLSFNGSASASRDSWPFTWSGSVAHSKRLGAFCFTSKVIPTKFLWEGQNVEVYEAWVENYDNGVGRLFFKLKLNGKKTREWHLRSCSKTISPYFRRPGKSYPDDGYGISWYPFFFDTVHTVRLSDSDFPEIKLQVGTQIWPKKAVHSTVSMSDIVLTFSLSPTD